MDIFLFIDDSYFQRDIMNIIFLPCIKYKNVFGRLDPLWKFLLLNLNHFLIK